MACASCTHAMGARSEGLCMWTRAVNRRSDYRRAATTPVACPPLWFAYVRLWG